MPDPNGELTQPDDSLRNDIEAAFKDTGGDSGGSVDAGGGAADPPVETSHEMAEAIEIEERAIAADRARNPDGTFAKQPDKPAAPEKVAAATEIPSTDATKASTEVSASAADAPPAGWTAEGKAAWQALAKELPTMSPAAQAAVRSMQMAALTRESSASAGSKQWSEEKQRYEAVLAPVAEAAGRRGLNVQQGVQALIQAQNILDANPVEGIKRIAATYGVNLATLAGQPSEVSSAEQQPDIRTLVQQYVQPIVAPIHERFRAEEQRQTDMTMQAINAFASAHEHYPEVEATIALVLPQVIGEHPEWSAEQKLQEAYDRALYATPSTRQQVLAQQAQAAEEARRKEAATRATKARSAAVSVTGSPQGSPGVDPDMPLRSLISNVMAGSIT